MIGRLNKKLLVKEVCPKPRRRPTAVIPEKVLKQWILNNEGKRNKCLDEDQQL